MKTILILDNKNYSESWPIYTRRAVRAIILSKSIKIALVHAPKKNFYKFPGGGIEANESAMDALMREVREESGLIVKEATIRPYGHVCEIRKSYDVDEIFQQDSYYYCCEVSTSKHFQDLSPSEKELGYELRYVSLDEAIAANEQYGFNHPEDTFVNRELAVLRLLAHRKREQD